MAIKTLLCVFHLHLWELFCSPGVFKNLHLTSATATLHQTSQATHTTTVTAQTFLQPSSNSSISTPAAVIPATPGAQAAAALGLLGCSAAGVTPTTTQVLIGNNICLSVQSAASLAGRHIPRTLGNMPASALKLSTSTNLQMPKVSGASSMDMGSRWDCSHTLVSVKLIILDSYLGRSVKIQKHFFCRTQYSLYFNLSM